MRISDLVQNYKEYLQALNRSPATIRTSVQELRSYSRFLAEKGLEDVSVVAVQVLENYVVWLTAPAKLKPATIEQKVTCLKRFYQFLHKTGRIGQNPTIDLLVPRFGERLPRTLLSVEETFRLIERPRTRTLIGIRDRTIMETLYSSAIRLNELCTLNVPDVDLTKGLLIVRNGKGAKDRIVPIGKKACRWIKKYRKKLKEQSGEPSTSRLFLGVQGKPIHKQTVQHAVRSYGKQAWINRPVTPHVLRHACASHMIANGADVIYVQQLLGHKRLETSSRYIRIAQNDVKQMIAEYHPREHYAKTHLN